MQQTLNGPCSHCPFRRGGHGVGLPIERFEEIVEHHTVFPCHKTVDYDAEDQKTNGIDTQACAGFLGYMTREGKTNALMQIGTVLRIFDSKRLDALASCPDIITTLDEGTLQHRYGGIT